MGLFRPAATKAAKVQAEITLSIFPFEIWEQIFASLALSELSSLSRVSRALYLYITPIIYKSFSIDLLEPTHPLSITNIPYLSSRRDRVQHQLKGLFGRKPPPQSSLGNRFLHTTHLTLYSHSNHKCETLHPPPLPNLRTLYLRPDQAENQGNFCYCRHTVYREACSQTPPCQCSLLDGLNPHALILGNSVGGLVGLGRGLWSPSAPLSKSVKHVLAFVGWTAAHEIGGDQICLFLDTLPSTVERLTLVLRSWGGGIGPDKPWQKPEGGPYDPDLLWDTVGRSCAGDARVVEVIGLETTDAGRTEDRVEFDKDEVRRAVQGRLYSKGWGEEAAQKRAEEVMFSTGEETAARVLAEDGKVLKEGWEVVKGIMRADMIAEGREVWDA